MAYKQDVTLVQSAIDVVGFLLLCIVHTIKAIVQLLLPGLCYTPKNYEGEVVLITGGGGGLGRLLAMRMARLKAKVVVWDINEKAIEETVKLVEGVGGKCYGYRCDLADKEDVYRIAKKTTAENGDVTILINNAGVVSGRLLLDTPDHLIKRTFDVNVMAHFWTAKAFLPKMIQNNKGHIVTIASMAAFVGINKLVDYCASKHAALGFDESLRVELEQMGITGVKTTVICPYFMQATGMFDDVNSRFFPTLKSNVVADRIMKAIDRDEIVVMIPGWFHFAIVLKQTFPWACVSMFLRNLVPDAVPCPTNPANSEASACTTTVSKKSQNGTAGTSLTHRTPLVEKQL